MFFPSASLYLEINKKQRAFLVCVTFGVAFALPCVRDDYSPCPVP